MSDIEEKQEKQTFVKTLILLCIDLVLWIGIWNMSDYILDHITYNQHARFAINSVLVSICIILLWLHYNNKLF
jgi:hypothetical protein